MLVHTLRIPPTWLRRSMPLSSVASLLPHVFLFARSTQMSSWALVLLTAERLISVWMPFKCKELCSRRRIVIAWSVISLQEDDHSGIPSYIRGRGHLLVAVWRQHALLLHGRHPVLPEELW